MPIYEIETDQGTFEIDADREPTQEEALQAISGQSQAVSSGITPPTPSTTTLTRALTPEEVIAQNYIRQEQRPGLNQALEALFTPVTTGVDLVKGLVNTGVGGVQGLATLLGTDVEDTTQPAPSIMQNLIGKALLSLVPGGQLAGSTQGRNLAQTALEVVPRATYELGQGVVGLASDPDKAEALFNPVQAAIRQYIEGSRTPTQSEIQRIVDAQQLPRALEEVGQQPIAPEIFGEANIPLARAAPLLLGAETAVTRGIPALGRGLTSAATKTASPFKTIASRGIISKPLEDAITRTTGITASEGSLEAAPIVKTRISQIPGNTPRTAKEFVDSSIKAQELALQDALTPLREAEKSGLVMKGDSMISSGREAVLRDFPSLANDAKAIDNVLTEFSYLQGDLNPTQGQGFLRELNRRYNGLENKNSPSASAYRAVRNELSNQTDEIIKAQTGKDISPYRDWGQLEDFKNGVQEQITTAQRTQGGRELPRSGGIPTTPRGAISKAAQSLPIARAFIPRAIESVDKGIVRIFKEVKTLPKASDLGEDAINGLRSKYQPSINAPPVIVDVETQIQNLISSYPQNIRSNPSLARAVAEAELAGQSTPLR